MLSFRERLELLERDLLTTPPAFISSSDLPFAVFRYDPTSEGEEEWMVRREVSKLGVRVGTASGGEVQMVSLAELYWKCIARAEGLESIVDLEIEQGFSAAETQVSAYLNSPAGWTPLTELLVEAVSNLSPKPSIVFLTRASVFAPSSYRLSALLERLMGKIKTPCVLFYPGTWRESLNYMGIRSDEEPLGSYRVKIYGRES